MSPLARPLLSWHKLPNAVTRITTARQEHAMQELLMTHGSVRSERDGWMDDNTRGLSLAAAAEWDEAAEAFAAAADVLARRGPDATSHDALGLILANLSQACFRAGRTREALAHAQRACSIRVALTGEDAMPVTRARMDLAVMLGSLGRLDEAQALMQRSISSMERHAGDEDVRLVALLENAARLALAAGSAANAEPLLLRLHALLDVHDLPTERADRLLAMVATMRAKSKPVAVVQSIAPSVAPALVPTAVYAHANVEEPTPLEPDEWDDQPLRDAVAITDVLLRTTPSGVIAIAEPTNHDAEILAAFEHVVDTPVEPMLELVDESSPDSVDIMLDLADDFDMVDLTTMESPVESAATSPVVKIEDDVAELVVEAEPAVEPLVEPLSALNAPLRPVVRHNEPVPMHGFGPPPPPVVLPQGSDSSAIAAQQFTSAPAREVPPPAATERPRAAAKPDEPTPAPRRAPMADRNAGSSGGNGGGGKSGMIIGGAAALAAAGAAAWFFLLR